MCKIKLKWALIAVIFVLTIITALCFLQVLSHALLFLPSQFSIVLSIPGLSYITFAGIVLVFTVCYFTGSKARTTLQTTVYSILLTQAVMVIIHAWLLIIEENTQLLVGASSEYLNAFFVSGFVSAGCSLLLIIVYNIMRIIRRKKAR